MRALGRGNKERLRFVGKKEEGEHGLGLKSIRYIAEKYGGKMSVQAEEGIFNLNILFPISEN